MKTYPLIFFAAASASFSIEETRPAIACGRCPVTPKNDIRKRRKSPPVKDGGFCA
jgi:hypothetical protein